MSLIYSSDVVFNDDLEMTELAERSCWDGIVDAFAESISTDPEFMPDETSESSVSAFDDNTTPEQQSTVDSPQQAVVEEVDSDPEGSVMRADLQEIIARRRLDDDDYDPIEDGLRADVEEIMERRGFNREANAVHQPFTPKTFKEAISCPEQAKWREAMRLELKALRENGTWKSATLPDGRKAIRSKWVYRIKFNSDGTINKYKARLVAKGFTQMEGVDFKETFAPTAKLKSVRLLLAIAAKRRWKIYQDDVPAAYLKSTLKEEIYMELPTGWEELLTRTNKDALGKPICDSDSKIVRLLKTLYGLKQSGREWNQTFATYVKSVGFLQSKEDPCIFRRVDNSQREILLGVYVDDILTTGDKIAVEEFRKQLQHKFNMDEGGLLSWYLGINVEFHDDGSISMDQDQYLQEKLEEFKEHIGTGGAATPLPSNYQSMLSLDSGTLDKSFPYRSMVGSLMYAMVGTRPDLAFPIQVVCQFMDKPTIAACSLVRHIYKYCRFNSYKLFFSSANDFILRGWSDASYANNLDYKSTSGYCFKLGNSLVSWSSGKQNITALSTAESETIGLTNAAQEAVWLRRILEELGIRQNSTEIFEDNQACIAMARNPQQHKRTKHIQVRYFFIREHLESGELLLTYCNTLNQLADPFTKLLSGPQLRSMIHRLGIQPVRSQGERQRFDSSQTDSTKQLEYSRSCHLRSA